MTILATRIWVGGIFSVLALLLSLTAGRVGATELQPPSHPGFTPPRSLAPKGPAVTLPRGYAPTGTAPTLGSGPLTYHGGAVQAFPHNIYAIYWGSGYNAGYKGLIDGFFKNLTADGGKTSNVYYSSSQYYQKSGNVTVHISPIQHYVASWSDTTLPATSGCASVAGGSTKCISDAQLRAEVTKAINTNGWPTGIGNEYFVFLGNGISTCYGAVGCAFVQFCAYHWNYTLNGATVLYANMPYTGHDLVGCGSKNYPNGNSAADSTINFISHEAIETITDPQGTGWYDSSGFEGGDKCAWDFGSPLGGANGAHYNQVINGAHYYLQQEWSNYSNKCVLTGK